MRQHRHESAVTNPMGNLHVSAAVTAPVDEISTSSAILSDDEHIGLTLLISQQSTKFVRIG